MRTIMVLLMVMLIMPSVTGFEVVQDDRQIILNATNESINNIKIYKPSFVSISMHQTNMSNETQTLDVNVDYGISLKFPIIFVYEENISTSIYELYYDYVVPNVVDFIVNFPSNIDLENNKSHLFVFNITSNSTDLLVLNANYTSTLFDFSKTFVLYPGETEVIVQKVDVPIGFQPMDISENFYLHANNTNYTIERQLNISVVDSVAPVVKIFAKDNKYNKPVNITINYSDNIGILQTKLKVRLPDDELKTWDNITSVLFESTDQIGRYKITAEAFDTSENYEIAEINFTIDKLKPINLQLDRNHDFGKVKIQNYTKFNFFELTEDIPINITLETLKGNVRVFLDTGGNEQELSSGNNSETVTIQNADRFWLGFRAPDTGYVEGKLKLSYPDYVEVEYDEFDFFAEFLQYTPTTNWTGDIFGEYPAELIPFEGETYADSYAMLKMKFPIDVRHDDLVFPLPKNAYDRLIADRDADVFAAEESATNAIGVSAMFIFLIFGITSLLIVNERIRPAFRWRT